MQKRCTKGKSCGATCIVRSDRCVIELGPLVSESISQVRSKLGVVKLYAQVKDQNIKGFQQRFNKVRGNLKGELGHQIRKTADVLELKRRLQEDGLLPKTKKSEDLGDIFARQIEAGKQERGGSVPPDLKAQLAALAPRQLERSPGAKEKTPPAVQQDLKKKDTPNTDQINSDLSRLMRGEAPKYMQVASAGGEGGMRARMKPTEIREVERQLKDVLGPKAKSSMNVDQLREAAAKEANSLSRKRNAENLYEVQNKINRLQSAIDKADALNATATGNTRWARVEAKDHDDALGPVRREGSKSYNGWKDSYGSGAQKIGEGAFGTVIKNPDGTFVKRGAISETEAELIRRLGERDLGPKLIAADINGKHPYNSERFVDIKNGRIAMGEVRGEPLGMAGPGTQFGGKNAADIYWKALADLHRQGIAHNDAHIDNILIDNTGKGRWVDLGLAQASPKAALAEAMGVFPTLRGAEATRVSGAAGQGNWQTRKWDGTGVKAAQQAREKGTNTWAEFQQRFPVASQVWENRPAAQYKLMDMGLSKNDISSIIDHGIRSTPESYTKGPWAKITDQQAQEVLNILYDGI